MIKTIGNIKIFAETYSNSYSWGHRAIVEFGPYKICEKIRYYNRTRESFQYQSVLKNCYWKILEEISWRQLEFFKDDLEKFKLYLQYND